MLIEAVVVLCLTNATDSAVFGQVRDGRFKITSARLSGASLTYREPVAQTPFPAVAAGEKGCVTIDALTLAQPRIVLWSGAPIAASDVVVDQEGDAVCLPATHPRVGQRLSFVYRKTLLGQLTCKETR
jgi:hypothetical protein